MPVGRQVLNQTIILVLLLSLFLSSCVSESEAVIDGNPMATEENLSFKEEKQLLVQPQARTQQIVSETQDPIELDFEYTPLGVSEWELYQDITANMNLTEISELANLRKSPRVVNFDGSLAVGYKSKDDCEGIIQKRNCLTRVIDRKTNVVVFDGESWVEGFRATHVGKEVVKVK